MTEFKEMAEVRELQSELGALRQRLEMRDEALRVLNRRLLHLEGHPSKVMGEREDRERLVTENKTLLADNISLRDQLESARMELAELRHTKMFRWTSPVRNLYAMLRNPR